MRSTIALSFLALCAGSLAAGDAPAAGKKILYVNAYHEGYAWSDGIEKGIKTVITPSGAELKMFRMDTKNNPAKEFAQQKGQEVKTLIDEWKPDVVIVSDDNPVRWILKPFYKDATTPFVFCAVNFNGKEYALPYANTSGMYEVSPVIPLVEQLAKNAKGKRVTWLAADVESSHTDGRYLGEDIKAKGYEFSEVYVKDWAGWKAAYTEIQGKSDMLLMLNAGIKDWNKDEAVAFHESEAKIPSGCMQAEVTPFCLLGYTKVPEEQGEWAANATLQILAGKKPSEVGETQNKKAKIFFNPKFAKKLGITPDVALIKQAEIVK